MFVFQEKLEEIAFGYGIRLTDLKGAGRMNALHWQTPAGTVSPVHDHPEEQFGYILKGVFEVTIGEEKQRNPYMRFKRLEDFLGMMGY